MADPDAGSSRSTRSWLEDLLGELTPTGERLGLAAPLRHAAELVKVNRAIAQRQVARQGGARAVAEWLVERFLEPWAG